MLLTSTTVSDFMIAQLNVSDPSTMKLIYVHVLVDLLLYVETNIIKNYYIHSYVVSHAYT